MEEAMGKSKQIAEGNLLEDSIVLMTGPTGEQGPQGIQGSVGDTGFTGFTGPSESCTSRNSR